MNLDRVSVFAEMMVQRATLKRYTKQKVVDWDLNVYYFSLINDQQSYWFPRLYLYADEIAPYNTFNGIYSFNKATQRSIGV